jgi:hypothetical protein
MNKKIIEITILFANNNPGFIDHTKTDQQNN